MSVQHVAHNNCISPRWPQKPCISSRFLLTSLQSSMRTTCTSVQTRAHLQSGRSIVASLLHDTISGHHHTRPRQPLTHCCVLVWCVHSSRSCLLVHAGVTEMLRSGMPSRTGTWSVCCQVEPQRQSRRSSGTAVGSLPAACTLSSPSGTSTRCLSKRLPTRMEGRCGASQCPRRATRLPLGATMAQSSCMGWQGARALSSS